MKKKKKFKDFSVPLKKELRPCESCGVEKEHLSSIHLSTRDRSRCYVGSGHRGIIGNYRVYVCEKCLYKIVKDIEKIIIS